jgi:N-methylhydantoinase B
MSNPAPPNEPLLKLRNDPITFEVLRHRLWQINDEQGQTIIRVSGSPVATEGNDFNVAITDADGNLIAVGPYIVMHVAAIAFVIRATIELIGERGIRPGDMYLVNDAWMGAGHQNDFCLVQPIFYEGERIAWTASVIHEVDVGGPVPGSWNFAARTTFEEAPRYKALRLVRDGEVQPEVLATVLTNTRLPDLVDLDMRAQIAAANVARERLFELIERYGIKVVHDIIADVLDYAQALMRQKLLHLPDGSWYAEDYIDHDGHEERNYRVCCRLTKAGDRLCFDFTGSSPQAPGLINTPYAGAAAGAYSAVYPYLCAQIPWNSGVLRQVDLVVEEGTIHHARFPAPVGYGVVHASWTTMNCAAATLGKMLASSDEPHEAMAGWAGSSFVYNIFGTTDADETFATMLLSSDLQGTGARAFGDGFDVGGKLNAPRSKATNIESAEANYPLLYLYRRHAVDSGGPGRWRGGVSGEVAFTAHGTRRIDLAVNSVGAGHTSTQGLNGGYPGAGSTAMLAKNSDIATQWAKGCLPSQLEDLQAESVAVTAPKMRVVLTPGDVFVAVPHGGGGYGDPLLRKPEQVARDVAEGNVSREWASRIYGVVLDAEGAVSPEGTELARADIRRNRIAKPGSSASPLPARVASDEDHVDALVAHDGIVRCGQCGTQLGALDNPKQGLVRVITDVGEAGPWVARRWNGKSPQTRLWHHFCPACAAALSIEQHLADSDETWIDSSVRALQDARIEDRVKGRMK